LRCWCSRCCRPVWAAPICLACAELAARHPVEGGYYRWACLAFGEFVGDQTAWLAWLTMFSTNAAFAVLFGNYLRHLVPGLTAPAHFAVAVGLVWLAVLLNYRGIRLVGTASVILTILIFLPFFFMTLLGLLRWQFNPSLFRLRSLGAGDSGGFRIPLGTRGLALMVAPAVVLAALVVVRGLWHDGRFDAEQALIDLVIFASGPLAYGLFRQRAPTS
jgi:amino acid transporter